MTAIYDSFLSPADLRVTQFSLLNNIKRFEQATITKLSERMLMDKTTLARNVRLLEKKGLIRIKTGKDRRFREISVTKKGADSLAMARPLWVQAQKYVVTSMGKNRMDQLIADLSELNGIRAR
jgi:DNA-binding MarR family transcriptional regulator